MNNYPEFVEIDGKKYKINTDFRIAIECNKIAEDETIGDYERALAIIYKLFGDEGINTSEHYQTLLEMAQFYLSCGEKIEKSNQKPNMDYVEDEKYIKSSFKYDYNYDPYSMKYLHWYEFYNDLNNLSNSEFGDCCILNRVRNLRDVNLTDIKDVKERERISKAKESVALSRDKKVKKATKEQKESAKKLYDWLGL